MAPEERRQSIFDAIATLGTTPRGRGCEEIGAPGENLFRIDTSRDAIVYTIDDEIDRITVLTITTDAIIVPPKEGPVSTFLRNLFGRK